MNKFTVIVLSLFLSGSISAQSLSNGEYFIKVNQTGKYIAVAGAATNNGAAVIQWDNEYKSHFRFILKSLGNNQYTLKAVHSGLFISTDGAAPVRGAKLLQWDWLNQDNQKWLIQPHKNGKGYVMRSVANGMKVIMQHWNAGTATPQNGACLMLTDDISVPDMVLDFKKNETGQVEENGLRLRKRKTAINYLTH